MSSDTWNQLQAHKRKQESLKERLLKRRKERQVLLEGDVANVLGTENPTPVSSKNEEDSATVSVKDSKQRHQDEDQVTEIDANLERNVAELLCNTLLNLPVSTNDIKDALHKNQKRKTSDAAIRTILEKLEAQALISVKKTASCLLVIECEYSKLEAVFEEKKGSEEKSKDGHTDSKKARKEREDNRSKSPATASKRTTSERRPDKTSTNKNAIESLLAMPTMKEKEINKVGEEIIELLNEPTAKELSLMEKFKSQGGTSVKEFCPYGTRDECRRNNTEKERCTKLHFKKIIQKHTDESLGDCSFLNTCFHMDTCKYVHYEVDYSACPDASKQKSAQQPNQSANHRQIAIERQKHILYPPQWVQCDMRYLDLEVLGKFSVVMADPPWDIHMELPYGTMQDDEMRTLRVGNLQDDGFIFLWVTGRAMELGRECLLVWGYERVDEIIWVKTNQLQRLIRTGRTGHWINHGKEHCLIGRKGNPKNINHGLDCDVLVSEVRDTSHKPDEIYGLIERLSPGTRKIELFGRQHNVQPNWITLGNQLRGVNLVDPDVVKRFKEKYPDGNCMKPVAAAAPPQR